ncbi:hypothetical protein BB558_004164 [Smittium angustum]|uniref:alpha-1,2-Mannosidase n=1 Tax=Smittium angustum TaxID=133377 RepID=A0A2U1J450_SMIAN|nr:hypothetical protein BB558_004164 [Smittium angustum]
MNFKYRFGFIPILFSIIVFYFIYFCYESQKNFKNGHKPKGNYQTKNGNLNVFIKSQAVKNAMAHAWNGYSTYAFGKDELLPVTNGWKNNWGGWGVTLIDSLDTLYIMDMHDDFKKARDFVETIDFSKTVGVDSISFFETTIRVLGGLISAYDLSNDKIFLKKAVEIADILLIAFDQNSGIPYKKIDVNNKKAIYGYGTSIAEIGSFQLEFMRLYNLTGNIEYHKKSQHVIDFIDKSEVPISGLYPKLVNITSGQLEGILTLGGDADSFYEYLLKLYIMHGKNGEQFRRMYEQSVDSIKEHMIYRSNKGSKLIFVSELYESTFAPSGEMQHLACFLPGLLALGSKELNRPDDLKLAKELMKTCYYFYKGTKTGLSPEKVKFSFDSNEHSWGSKSKNINIVNRKPNDEPDFNIVKAEYILRPEAVESLMILYRVTGDEIYREWGWIIFNSFEKHLKTPKAYSAFRDVSIDEGASSKTDSMESFFLAETLKYLYMLFSPPDFYSLDEYVFNTEAHLFKIMKR